MPYCPQCGREQNCGCEECHACGVTLEDTRGPARVQATRKARGPKREAAPEEPSIARFDEEEAPRVDWLAHVFVILGAGVLIMTLFSMLDAANRFPTIGPFATPGEGIRRLGYYAGVLLYTNSARILTGVALFAAGALIGKGGPDTRGRWESAVRWTGFTMGIVGLAFIITTIFIVLPLGPPPFALQGMLPALWAAVPVLLAGGLALIGSGYLMAARLSPRPRSLLEGREDKIRATAEAMHGSANETHGGPEAVTGERLQGGRD